MNQPCDFARTLFIDEQPADDATIIVAARSLDWNKSATAFDCELVTWPEAELDMAIAKVKTIAKIEN